MSVFFFIIFLDFYTYLDLIKSLCLFTRFESLFTVRNLSYDVLSILWREFWRFIVFCFWVRLCWDICKSNWLSSLQRFLLITWIILTVSLKVFFKHHWATAGGTLILVFNLVFKAITVKNMPILAVNYEYVHIKALIAEIAHLIVILIIFCLIRTRSNCYRIWCRYEIKNSSLWLFWLLLLFHIFLLLFLCRRIL